MTDKHADDGNRTKFTLDLPITYQIEIAGRPSGNWSDWMDTKIIQVEKDASGLTTTTLTGTFDQAALIGLLRRLYSLGLPLISVNRCEG